MIQFACALCGMKFQVKDELAGRAGKCPTCKESLVVPQPTKPAAAPTGQISGTPSSLHQAGLDVGVTLDVPGGSTSGERSAVADLLAGRARTGGRYVIEKEIARGGMGAVVRAVDCDIRREVAVKYMLNDGDVSQKARFVEEAQITGQLEHPNIVPIHELGVDAEKRLFFAMKMVKGRSLAQVLDELRKQPATAEQKWSLNRLLTIMTNVCYALAYAHSRGVIHRDLKPANIMLGDFGETYVMDWGLAKVIKLNEPAPPPEAPSASEFTIRTKPSSPAGSTVVGSALEGSHSGSTKVVTGREVEGELTQEGAVMGTPSYMSPEQARGEVQSLDGRTDIYSLGAILYELLALVTPVEKGGGPMALLMRVAEGKILPPEHRAPDRAKAGKIPKELAAIAMKALALRPDNRYQTAEGLRRDIQRFQEGRSVSAKHDTPWESAVKFAKRNKAFSAATGAGIAILTTVLAFAFNVNYAARVRAEEALVLADQNFVAFEAEQKAKNDAIRNSIPGTLRAARQLANDGAVPEALAQIALVRSYEPHNAEARLLVGQILTAQLKWPEAAEELGLYLRQRPQDRDAAALYKITLAGKTDDLIARFALADVLQRHQLFNLTAQLLADAAKLRDMRKPLADLYDEQLKSVWPKIGVNRGENGQFRVDFLNYQNLDLRPLAGMQLDVLNFSYCDNLADLEPLRGIPLQDLNFSICPKIENLGPLRGMQLKRLKIWECGKVADLEPLRGMPLEYLSLYRAQVSDLGPLEGMPLTYLNIQGCPVSELGALRGMPLEFFGANSTGIRDLEPLRGAPCESLALAGCTGITRLDGVQGMPLTALDISACQNIEGLEPLRDMRLKMLNIYGCNKVVDLEPLRGMPLTYLGMNSSGVQDLTPLAGMPLERIVITYEKITHGLETLRALKSLKQIGMTGIGDLPAAEFWRRYDAGEFKKK
jgi:serine/threonine protein kinase